MRALLTVATAALALGVLAGCGDASTPGAPDQTTTTATTTSEQLATTPGFPATSDETTPQSPPATKPQNPPSEPSVTIGNDGFVVPPGVTAVPAWQIEGVALPEDYEENRDKVWVHEDGFTLELIAYASSGCSGAEAVLVDQSADAVKILLRPQDQPQGGRPDDSICTAVMTPRLVVVTLDQPLQDRKILLSAGR